MVQTCNSFPAPVEFGLGYFLTPMQKRHVIDVVRLLCVNFRGAEAKSRVRVP